MSPVKEHVLNEEQSFCAPAEGVQEVFTCFGSTVISATVNALKSISAWAMIYLGIKSCFQKNLINDLFSLSVILLNV
jgi:hypothetical protein